MSDIGYIVTATDKETGEQRKVKGLWYTETEADAVECALDCLPEDMDAEDYSWSARLVRR